MNCNRHDGHPLVKVCFSCNDQLVCAECTKLDHSSHIFREMEEVGKERQKTLLQNLRETEAAVLAIQQDLEKLQTHSEGNRYRSKEVADKIQRRSRDIQDAVNQYTKQLVFICERHHNNNEYDIAEAKVRLDSELLNAFKTLGIIQAALESENFPQIIETEKFHRNNQLKRQVVPMRSPRNVAFVHGAGTVGNLRDVFGDIEIQQDGHPQRVRNDFETREESENAKRRKQHDGCNVCDTTVTSAFEQTTTSYGVCFLCPSHASADDCWIRLEKTNEIKLVTRTGKVKQIVRFDTSVACIANTAEGQIAVTCPDSHTIQEVQLDGTKKTLFHLDRLSPRAICLTTEGNLLMSLVEKWSYALSAFSTRKIAKYTVRGYKMAEAEYDGYRKRLFIKPSRIAASPASGDIAVINRTEYETSHLVILDKHLRLKFRYFGDGKIIPNSKRYCGKESVQFCPQDVQYDKGNHILIAELYSCSIQLIDGSGHLLKILHIDEDIPWSMAVHSDQQVWTGYNSGKVKVLSYRKYPLLNISRTSHLKCHYYFFRKDVR
ncbi:uncharacterized protein LOC132548755 [Ylistrum balloti]|uniref:uncharacterized protein LOC132548755 n=1 Tax=Ylistrum balloti TaxID=509963 RepID=UPI0029059D92|nr:uncharacterized protein LOC132548755 [Ylistrum balloti]